MSEQQPEHNGRRPTTAGMATGLVVTIAGSLVVLVASWTGAGVQTQGVGLALAFAGLGLVAAAWARNTGDGRVAVEPRHPMPSSDEQRQAVAEAAVPAGEPLTKMGTRRRRGLAALAGLAGATVVAALAAPLRSLGTNPLPALRTTAWQQGRRLVDSEGRPIRMGDLAVGSVATAFPEGDETRADSQVVLIRLAPSALRLPADRAAGAEQGHVAYSKVCTHAGCPVGLFDTDTAQLLCPCHQSVFLATEGARPTTGPAARALPQLPIGLDGDGAFIALGDFPEPVGPSFWSRGRS